MLNIYDKKESIAKKWDNCFYAKIQITYKGEDPKITEQFFLSTLDLDKWLEFYNLNYAEFSKAELIEVKELQNIGKLLLKMSAYDLAEYEIIKKYVNKPYMLRYLTIKPESRSILKMTGISV